MGIAKRWNVGFWFENADYEFGWREFLLIVRRGFNFERDVQWDEQKKNRQKH